MAKSTGATSPAGRRRVQREKINAKRARNGEGEERGGGVGEEGRGTTRPRRRRYEVGLRRRAGLSWAGGPPRLKELFQGR